MKLVVAIREHSASKARDYLSGLGAEIIKSRFETQDPALRNLVDGLVSRGLQLECDGVGLHWYLVTSPLAAEHWLVHESVAVCFTHAWLHQQAMAIRYLKGIAYCDAAAAWADFLPFEQTPAVQLASHGGIDWRGLPVINVITQETADNAGPGAQDDKGQGKAKAIENAPIVAVAAQAEECVKIDQGTKKMRTGKSALASEPQAPDAAESMSAQLHVAMPAQVKSGRKLSLKKSIDIVHAADAKDPTPTLVTEPELQAAIKPVKKSRSRKQPIREQEEQLDLFG